MDEKSKPVMFNIEKASVEELQNIKDAIVKKLAIDTQKAKDSGLMYNEHGSYHRNNSTLLKEKIINPSQE